MPIQRQEDTRLAVEDPAGADEEPAAQRSDATGGGPRARPDGGDRAAAQVDASADPTLE